MERNHPLPRGRSPHSQTNFIGKQTILGNNRSAKGATAESSIVRVPEML